MSKHMKSSKDLMNDKSFYTLIRRFKYQYKKYHAIKDLDDVYWDRHIVRARLNAERELEDTTNRIVLMVLGGFINPNNTELEFSQDIEPCYSGFGTRLGEFVRGREYHKVAIDDRELYDFAKELIYNYWQE